MPEDVFVAISPDALHAKSKVYVGRAMARKAADDLDEYQLWASLALELLGKAALARRHPSLVVDPTHWQSLFVAAGIAVSTDVKTITAKTLFERLVHLVPRFDKAMQTFCQGIAERRNAELHSADIPFRTMRLEAWEARYWHACDAILRHMETSLEDWMGAAEAAAPRQLLEEAAAALEAAVRLRVQVCAEGFQTLGKPERERRRQLAAEMDEVTRTALFSHPSNEVWAVTCPACECDGAATGEQTGEEISEEQEEHAIWEIVDREFYAEDFRCPACDLSLSGGEELDAAGIERRYEDQQEREMEYEPDYGND